MPKYVDDIEMESCVCGACGITWAMPRDYLNARRKDGKGFSCPNGDSRAYCTTTEDRLRRELEQKERELTNARSRAMTAEHECQQITKAHKKMRSRVMNGVCPCCNRTFSNLREHMKTQHSDFSEKASLSVLRMAFGMTQGAVADEASVRAYHVSLYERDKPVPSHVKTRLEAWISTHESEQP